MLYCCHFHYMQLLLLQLLPPLSTSTLPHYHYLLLLLLLALPTPQPRHYRYLLLVFGISLPKKCILVTLIIITVKTFGASAIMCVCGHACVCMIVCMYVCLFSLYLTSNEYFHKLTAV